MGIFQYTMPVSCFPRYRYTRNIRQNLARRYNNLKSRIKRDWPEVDLVDEEIVNVSIFLSKFWLKEEQLASIRSLYLSAYIKTETKTTDNFDFETFFKENILNENSFVVTSMLEVADKIAALENFPAHTIFVEENNTNGSVSSFVYNDKKNIHTCSSMVESVRRVISTHLERCALIGMKAACEFLEGIALDDLQLTSEEKTKPKTAKLNSQRRSQPWMHQYKHQQNCKKESLTECKERIKETKDRLIDEIVGMFNRSQLPKHEHPDLSICIERNVDEKLLQDLRRLSPTIRSCGYRFGMFQVYVDDTHFSENVNDSIGKTLKKYEIAAYSIVPLEIKLFSQYKVGDKVSVKLSKEQFNGTLGGFANTYSGESKRLWVLMSRHVASHCLDRKLYINEGKDCVAKFMTSFTQHSDPKTKKPYLDIAAACVEKEFESKCDIRYFTESGTPLQGKLCSFDASKLKGLPVYIRGASTSLGRGTITVSKQYSLQGDGVDENYIFVEDRDSLDSDRNDEFCKEGDSGAIVCAEFPDNSDEKVQLISMVVGGNKGQPKFYATVRLDKGIGELKKLTDEEFTLC